MGFGFLLLLVLLVPHSRAKDLRPKAASAVDRRSAPDALLGEIFNDPSATSLTKLNLEDSDSDKDDFSGSGSELWSGSGELPRPSEDSSLQSATVTNDGSQQKQQIELTTQTEPSANANNSTSNNSDDTKDNAATISSSNSTNNDTNNTPESTNAQIASITAQNTPPQTSTDTPSTSSSVTSQEADTKLPSSEDQSQNSVVQTEENNKSSKDTSATTADFLPAQLQSSVENIQDNPAAALVEQQIPGFDDNSLYDPTIVKKTNVPVAPDSMFIPLVNDTMDIAGTVRSGIPQAPVLSPQSPAVPKATVAQIPYKGSFPLRLHKYSPYTKLLKKGLVPKPGPGKNQQAAKKSVVPQSSVVPSFNEAGGLRPLTVNLPQQQQNAQGYPQPQSQPLDANPALNPAQMPFGDQPEATAQAPPAAQPFAPVPAESEAVSQGPVQNSQQALDQAQGGVPQSFQQGFYPQAAEQSEMQIPGAQNMTAAFPMNASMNNAMFPSMSQETAGIPPQGAQVVPVYQGLKPKKPMIEEDECEDQFDTCPEMRKNDYCTKYPTLMKIQCKKSCGFCEIKKHDESSGSGYDEYDESGSAARLYYADEVSGSGTSDWKEDEDDDEDEPGYRKSGIPQPLHKVLMSKFASASGSGSGSGSFELDESSTSDDDISQTSGSGAEGSAAQKKGEVQANTASSGSGEGPKPISSSPTTGAGPAEIGSGSASLAEDLATGTVSRTNEKHSSIPRPPATVQQVSLYPKIDLKEIAKAVKVYRGVALKMLGEALEGAAEEKQEELSKKSHIPLPPATGILQQMGFPVGYEQGAKRNMIPNAIPMDPNYGMLGYGNNGYGYSNPQPMANEPLSDFYGQYQQMPNMARSDIMAAPEEEQASEEGAAQEDQPEEIEPVTLPAEAEIGNMTEKQDDKQETLEASKNETTGNNNKKSDIVDPYEYVRNMGKGASMEPIRSKTASNFESASHSDALILWKNSQSTKLMNLAKKKSIIPQPEFQPAPAAFPESQFAQPPEQQFRSDISQQNITSDTPYISGQAFPQSAPIFPQITPQSDALTQSPGDDLAARSQITQSFVNQQQPQQQPQGEQDSNLRELRSYFPEDE